ncbi:MAG: hypothetical protein KDC87_00885 [Planctomycetes bacterium]|nr:hypothetical protein [Planctomycetota bacterium]MCB9868839.1 hypothetical protein [Planctomycetota bacterium]MCB9889553.1 hypothetical protein [Planctomycetota bacterium]
MNAKSPTPRGHWTPRAALLLLLATACSHGSSGSSTPQLDTQIIEFSLGHIVTRRIHQDVFEPTVIEAINNPFRALSATPPPPEACVEVVSVTGDLSAGFDWRLRLTECIDANGVTRKFSGAITLHGDPLNGFDYTGSYEGILSVEWSEDPDGGRAAEAAKLNAEANTVTVKGVWRLSNSARGELQGTAFYSSGWVTQLKEYE